MKITDEMLSAFLDAELPEAQMAQIREALKNDEGLADRIAELALVDHLVALNAGAVDAKPMPAESRKLLEQAQRAEPKSNVVAFPLWKRVHRQLQEHVALAASFALLAGMGIAQLIPSDTNPAAQHAALASALSHTRSGDTVQIGDALSITPRLSFSQQDGLPCRQYEQSEGGQRSMNIACRSGTDEWRVVASVFAQAEGGEGFQVASNTAVINQLVEQMAVGDFYDSAAESKAIAERWPPQAKED